MKRLLLNVFSSVRSRKNIPALFLGTLCVIAFATPSFVKAEFAPGETLDPGCAPTTSTCTVLQVSANTTTGNFGIGTTSPYAKFSVVGEIVASYFTGTTTATSTFGGALSVSGTGTSTFANGINLSSGCFAVAGVCLTGGGGGGSGTVSSGTTGQLAFYNSAGTTITATSTLFLSQAGNFGIGSTTPTSKLSVGGGNITHLASGNPLLQATLDTAGSSNGVFISGEYAYVADAGSGLQIVDISNPTYPILVGTYDTSGSASNVFVSGKYAYIADFNGGLVILDVSSPASPSLVGSYTASGNVNNVVVSGPYAYLASSAAGIEIVNISNPASPLLVGSYNTSGSAYYVYVSGKYAYVADGTSGIHVIDVSNAANPSLMGTYDTSGLAIAVYVSGKYAYIADGASGLQIVNISNPASPSFVGVYNTPGSAQNVFVSGKYAYVADQGSGLHVIDVSNAANPSLVGSYDTAGTSYGIYVSGKYAYVADAASGLQVLDINGLETPTITTGNIEVGAVNVNENLNVEGRVNTNGGLNVGISGIFSRGTIASYVSSTTATNLVSATFMGGNVGIGTTSPYAKLSVVGQVVAAYFTGTTTATSTLAGGLRTSALDVFGSATSTFANGLNLSGGCFAINGTCVGGSGGGGSGTVNSGTTGQIGYYVGNGTAITGTSTLLIGTDGGVTLGGASGGVLRGLDDSSAGAITVRGGDGNGAGNATFRAGDGASGGNVTLRGGSGNAISGGTVTINGGDDSGGGTPGAVTIRGGEAGVGGGGAVTLRGGDADTGGAVTVRGGNGTGNLGGGLTLKGGNDSASNGAQITLNGGSSGSGGNIEILSGSGEGGSSVTIRTPNAGAAGANAGDVTMYAGDGASDGNGGNVRIYPGALSGAGVVGNIYLGWTGSVARGNVLIGTTTILGPLTMNSGAYVTTGGTWTNASSRDLKENFVDLEPETILAKINSLNIPQWNYKAEAAEVKHIGPIAEEFYAAFGLGGPRGEKSVSSIDPAGVALVGIQALTKRIEVLTQSITASVFAAFESMGVTITNGLAAFKNIFADEVKTNKLCLDDICVTKTQLKTLLLNNGLYIDAPTPVPVAPESVVTEPLAEPLIDESIVDDLATSSPSVPEISESLEDTATTTEQVEQGIAEDLMVAEPGSSLEEVSSLEVLEPIEGESTEPIIEVAPVETSAEDTPVEVEL